MGPVLSVVISVGDAEESVGREVRTMAAHLRGRGLLFEILAFSDGCCDNSLAVLQMMGREIPELRLVGGDARGRAFLRGAGEARGEFVALAEAGAPFPVGMLGWALRQLDLGKDAVVFRGRGIVARRMPCLAAIVGSRGRGDGFHRTFEQQAAMGTRRLALELVGTRGRVGLLQPVLRFLTA